jgi:uncharacterized protein (DUF2062 family)
MRLIERLKKLMPSPQAMASNRWLRWLGPALLHPRLWHMHRRGVATGAAIGVFFAFITPIAQIPLSAAFSVLLRANLPAAVVGTLVNTPPTFGPVYYAAWRVGSWVLDEPADEAHTPAALAAPSVPEHPAGRQGWWNRASHVLEDVGLPLLVGAALFSVVFSALAYVVVSVVWVFTVRAKRRRRLAGHGERS